MASERRMPHRCFEHRECVEVSEAGCFGMGSGQSLANTRQHCDGFEAPAIDISAWSGIHLPHCVVAMMSSHPHRHCPLLDRDGPTRRLRDAPSPWELHECLETGFVFLANPPSQEQFKLEFAWERTHAEESARRQSEEPMLYAVSRACKIFRHRWLKRDKLVGMVKSIVSRRGQQSFHIIDVGCSDAGLFQRLVDSLSPDVVAKITPIGVEISTHLATVADTRLQRYGGRCIHGSGIDALREIPEGTVDVVILGCVLEHELDPVTLLSRCRERLSPDGVVVVKVPNYACFGRHLRGSRWCGYRWPDHVNYFTPQSLTRAARQAGLRVARMGLRDCSLLSDSLYAIFRRQGSDVLRSASPEKAA